MEYNENRDLEELKRVLHLIALMNGKYSKELTKKAIEDYEKRNAKIKLSDFFKKIKEAFN